MREYRKEIEELQAKTTLIRIRKSWKDKLKGVRSCKKELTERKDQQQEELEQKYSVKEEQKATTWTCRETGLEERIPETQGPPEKAETDTEQ